MSEPPAKAGVALLPLWPLTLMFGCLPVWWGLGLFYLIWPVLGALLLALLVVHGRVMLPAGTMCWLGFVAFAVISVFRLERANALVIFVLRIGYLLTAIVVCWYVYTALREGRSWARVFRPLCLFWLWLVALGWLGVLLPSFSSTTPAEIALPNGIISPYLNDLVHLTATEYNRTLHLFTGRPSAPYPYTNNWGSAYALLVPCVVAYVMSVRGGALRVVLLASLPLSLVPAFLTLNRGMLVCLGIALVLIGLRALRRGDARIAASAVGVGLLGALVSFIIPVQALIEQRLNESGSTADRRELYIATVQAVLRSPLLGYGAPTAVDTTSARAPLGTQGQLWQVMFSHGLPALIFFLAWFIIVARRLAPATSPAGQWLSTVPIVALIQMPFYGFTDPNMALIFFAAGLGLAAVDGPVNRTPPVTSAPPAAGTPTPVRFSTSVRTGSWLRSNSAVRSVPG